MPLVAGNYNPAAGVLVQVAILPQTQIATLQGSRGGGSLPNPANITMFPALIDTGASVTCISSNVIKSLELKPSGKTLMSGSTGQSPVDQYTFIVGFMFGVQQTPTGAFTGELNAHLVQGCEFVHHGFGFDVLIGRDILCKGSFTLTFDGHYALAF
jgi:Aspartyl protease